MQAGKNRNQISQTTEHRTNIPEKDDNSKDVYAILRQAVGRELKTTKIPPLLSKSDNTYIANPEDKAELLANLFAATSNVVSKSFK